jgi:hypothetical protein
MNAQKYILRTLLWIVIVVLLVLGINYWVDPYGITGASRIAHLNQYKVDINNHTRLLKRYQPQTMPFDTLVLGNSRVEMGVDPAHACFIAQGMKVYNLGMPGADIRTQIDYALNTIYQQPIKHVFLSVDFIDFISTEMEHPRVIPLSEERTGKLKLLPSAEANPDYVTVWFLDYYKSLFSLDALVSSFRTVSMQGPEATDRDVRGFNPAREFGEMSRIEGPRALFDQKMEKLQKKYSASWYLRNSKGQLSPSVNDIADFLDIAAERGIKVYAFTHPFHESYWELMRSQGLMSLYGDWMEAMEALFGGREAGSVSFWDFSQD